MKLYYNSNKLKINIEKTQVMLVNAPKEISVNLNINDTFYKYTSYQSSVKIISNKPTMKILGTVFSANNCFNENISKGSYGFYTQIKRRSAAIIRIASNYDIKFKSQLVHGLLLGKIRYNIQTWGNINLDLKYKINRVILSTVEGITKNLWFGKNVKYKMKQMGIPTFYQMYNNACFKQMYKILNVNTNNMLNNILTKNRNINMLSQNKCNTFFTNDKPSLHTRKSFEHIFRDKFNKLPRGLTLAPSVSNFSKWLNIYNNTGEFTRFPIRKDNMTVPYHPFSTINVFHCSNG